MISAPKLYSGRRLCYTPSERLFPSVMHGISTRTNQSGRASEAHTGPARAKGERRRHLVAAPTPLAGEALPLLSSPLRKRKRIVLFFLSFLLCLLHFVASMRGFCEDLVLSKFRLSFDQNEMIVVYSLKKYSRSPYFVPSTFASNYSPSEATCDLQHTLGSPDTAPASPFVPCSVRGFAATKFYLIFILFILFLSKILSYF